MLCKYQPLIHILQGSAFTKTQRTNGVILAYLSERDPLCRRGSRVNFMKLTLLPRRCIYRKADRVPTKGWKVAGSKPGTHRELCGATPMVLSHSAHVSTRRPKATKCHCSTAGQKPKSFARVRQTTPEEGGSPRPRAFLLSERDPLCDKCIGAEAELTS